MGSRKTKARKANNQMKKITDTNEKEKNKNETHMKYS